MNLTRNFLTLPTSRTLLGHSVEVDPLSKVSPLEKVYAIAADDAIKIGFSKTPLYRLSSLQTDNHRNVELLFLLATDDMATLEGFLHTRYHEFHVRGEWFKLDRLYLMADVGAMIARGELPIAMFNPIYKAETTSLPREIYQERDEKYDAAFELVKLRGYASMSLFQRHLRIGSGRAKAIYEDMERNRVFSRMGLRKDPNGGYR